MGFFYYNLTVHDILLIKLYFKATLTDKLVELWEIEYPEQSSLFPTFFKWEEKMIAISDIGFHPPNNMEKARHYLELMKEGTDFPPLVVLNLGVEHYELIDGFHRIWTKNQLCETFVKVFVGSSRYERCS